MLDLEPCNNWSVGNSDELSVDDIVRLAEKFDGEVNSGHLESITDTNKAMQLFSKPIIKNRDKVDKEQFYKIYRTYLNILDYVEGEKKILPALLRHFSELDCETQKKINNLSRCGKYRSMSRTLRYIEDEVYIEKFLNLLYDFVTKTDYNILLKNLETFVTQTKHTKHALGPAALTGILSALQPDLFAVYNTPSALPFKDDIRYSKLYRMDMIQYCEFNYIYRRISRYTGKRLIELDTIAYA